MKTGEEREIPKNSRRSFRKSNIGILILSIIIFLIIVSAIFFIILRSPNIPLEEEEIGFDIYWQLDMKEVGYVTSGGNASVAYRLEGSANNPQVDRIYIGASNKLIALDPNTAKEVWSSPIQTVGDIATPVVVVNYGENYGISDEDYAVFVGTSEGYLYAVNDTESVNTTIKELDSAVSSIAIYNNVSAKARASSDIIYVGTTKGTLYAFSAVNYSELWSLSLDGEVHMTSHPLRSSSVYPASSPSLNQNGTILVVGTDAGSLYSISTTTHTVLWSWNYNSALGWSSSPIIGAKEHNIEIVHLGTDDGWLYAFYIENSTEIAEWKELEYEKRGNPERRGIPVINTEGLPDGGILTTPCVLWGGSDAGTYLYVGSSSGSFYRINRNTIGSPGTSYYKPPGSTLSEFKERVGQNLNFRFDVQPVFYPFAGSPKYVLVVENHDNGTAQLDDDKGIIYALNAGNLSVELKRSVNLTNVKLSAIINIPFAMASGQLCDNVWFITSDAVVFSCAVCL